MKKFLFLALLPVSLSASQYVSFHGGTDYGFKTDVSNSGQKVGFKAGVTYGYGFSENLRGELEISYRQSHKRTVYDEQNDSKQFQSNYSWAYMANIIYDIAQLNFKTVTPYVGLGAGYCKNVDHQKVKAIEVISEKFRDNRIAYQLIVGGKYPIDENYSISADYKYFIGQQHKKNHSVNLGLARNF